jgi:hypothetical protein
MPISVLGRPPVSPYADFAVGCVARGSLETLRHEVEELLQFNLVELGR